LGAPNISGVVAMAKKQIDENKTTKELITRLLSGIVLGLKEGRKLINCPHWDDKVNKDYTIIILKW